MAASLDLHLLQQLSTAGARALHDVTDKLGSSCGIGGIARPPQIVVVGDQSAGKSSVLEAISHIRFPVKQQACTRFPIELVLCRAAETRIYACVGLADKSKAPTKLDTSTFSQDNLDEIVREADECIDLEDPDQDFSKNVLRLEIEGPGIHPLTLIDLPGLPYDTTAGSPSTGPDDIGELVRSYMKQENTIIVVVVAAGSQLADNEALLMAKEYDPRRERTMGVITKPDLVRAGHAQEPRYIRLAKNRDKDHELKLGWHVLRNRADEGDTDLNTRDAVEERFFNETAWRSVRPQDRGAASLRTKLSKALYSHLRRSVPGVIQEIERTIKDTQRELDQLGGARSTPEDMRSFLLTIAGEFQRLARDGVHGRYGDAFFGDLDESQNKLRATLRNFNRAFDHVLETRGSKLAIVRPDSSAAEARRAPDFLARFLAQHPYEFPDPERVTVGDLNAQLRKQAALNQGCEFPGSPNKELVIQLFQKQAAPWGGIAAFHVKQVTLVAKSFVDHIFRHLLGSPDTSPTAQAILSTCVDPFFASKEAALAEKLDEILRPYARGYATPLDAEFRRGLAARSLARLQGKVESKLAEGPGRSGTESCLKAAQDLLQRAMPQDLELDGGEFATERTIDMMETYYEVSLDTPARPGRRR